MRGAWKPAKRPDFITPERRSGRQGQVGGNLWAATGKFKGGDGKNNGLAGG
jgi:hypothetical protein